MRNQDEGRKLADSETIEKDSGKSPEDLEVKFQGEQTRLDGVEPKQEDCVREPSHEGGYGEKIERVEDLFTDDW